MEKQKTAMQQLIDDLTFNAKNIIPMDIDEILAFIEGNSLLELERQQMENAFNQCIEPFHEMTFEQYYEETFETK